MRFLLHLLVTAWLGFLTAAAIQAHRPASLASVLGVDTKAKVPPGAPDLLDRMEQTIWRRNAPLELGEAEVNRYLAASLAGQQQGPTRLVAQFDAVALSFQPGLCRVWLRWKAGDRPKTATFDFTVARDHKHFVIEPRGGALGRLPVFRGALATLIPGLRNLCSALDEEIHAVFQMNQIRFEKNKVILDPRFEPEK